jgi:hypothetical protein
MERRTYGGEMNEWVQKVREALLSRRYAYQKTFDPNGAMSSVVLKDLARFCRAHETTFSENDRAHVLAEGRREVWLRIQNHLRLTPEQLWLLYSGRPADEE